MPTPPGKKTPKMLEVEKKIGCSLEEDFNEYYIKKKWGQKRLAKKWRVGRNLIFGKNLRGGRRSWSQMLDFHVRRLGNEKAIFDNRTLVSEYEKIKPLYEACTEKFESLIKNLIKESGLKKLSITSRTKDIEALSKKVLGEIEKYRKASDVSDLAGVRICCYLSSEVENVATLIRDNFIILPELSIDKRDTLEPDRFGYLSLHYIIKLSNKRARLPEFKKYKDLLCEIQIRTILQHAWAEIEHDLGYKTDIEIPKKIKRKFSMLAGLLELADEQFDNIKLQIEKYSREISKKIVTEPKEVLIDKISIYNYLLKSPTVKEIDKKIVEITGWVLSGEPGKAIGIKVLVDMCNYFDIKTIQELENMLKRYKRIIINYTKDSFAGKKIKKRIVNGGISLFYLGYVKTEEQVKKDS